MKKGLMLFLAMLFFTTAAIAEDPESVIGIIGGADGPTSILLTTDSGLDSFIHQCIMEHNSDLYLHPVKNGYANESHTVLGTECSENQIIVYTWTLYQEWELREGELIDVSGGHIPTVFTLEQQSDGAWNLLEYWEPRDGEYYGKDIRDKMPEDIQRALWKEESSQARFDETRMDAMRYFYGDESNDEIDIEPEIMQGTVVSFEGNSMIVRPIDHPPETARAGLFRVPITHQENFEYTA